MFGNGKTALKFNWGVPRLATNDPLYTANNPGTRSSANAERGWTDTNGNKVVDCDLLNPAAQLASAGATRARPPSATPRTSASWGGDDRQPRRAERVGQASGRLAVDGHGAAGAHPARVGGRRLHPPRLPRVLRHRRPQPQREHGVRNLHADGADRLAAAQRRRVIRSRCTRRPRRPRRCRQDLPDVGHRLRSGAHQLLARGGHPRQRAPARRPGPGRAARPRRRSVVDTCGDGDEVGTRSTRPPTSPSDPTRAAVTTSIRSRQPVRALAPNYVIPKIDVLIAATIRSQPPVQFGAATGTVAGGGNVGAVGRAELPHRGGARPSAGRRDGHRHHDGSDHRQRQPRVRGQSSDAARHALRQGAALRPHAVGHRARSQQPAEHELPDRLQHAYQYSVGNTAQGGTWGNPTTIYTARFMRVNFTFDF